MLCNTCQREKFKATLRKITQNINTLLLTRKYLSHYAQGEFNVLVMLLQHGREEKWNSAHENPFYQCLRDDETLSNHVKYQAMGTFSVDVKYRKNHVLAIVFVKSLIKTDESIYLLLEKTCGSRTTLKIKEVSGCTTYDAAIKGVAKVVGHDSEACKINSGEKLASSVCGLMFRTNDKKPVNPLPEGDELMARIHNFFHTLALQKVMII